MQGKFNLVISLSGFVASRNSPRYVFSLKKLKFFCQHEGSGAVLWVCVVGVERHTTAPSYGKIYIHVFLCLRVCSSYVHPPPTPFTYKIPGWSSCSVQESANNAITMVTFTYYLTLNVFNYILLLPFCLQLRRRSKIFCVQFSS